MIKVEKREAIRRAYFVEEKSIRQIAKEFRCSRPTVRKAIASAEFTPYTLDVPRRAPVLEPYKARGEAVVIITGERVTVQLFIMRLCYSRRMFVMAFPAQKQEAFFEGHVRAFHHFQGAPPRIGYDNLKAAVRRALAGCNRQEQESFIVFRSHYLFVSHFRTPVQGHEKGQVEGAVGSARHYFLVPIPEVASVEELNAHLLTACLADDQRRVDRQKMTIGAAWEREQPYLRPLRKHDYSVVPTNL